MSERGPRAIGGGGGGGGGSSCQAVEAGTASSLNAARNPAVPPNPDALLCTAQSKTHVREALLETSFQITASMCLQTVAWGGPMPRPFTASIACKSVLSAARQLDRAEATWRLLALDAPARLCLRRRPGLRSRVASIPKAPGARHRAVVLARQGAALRACRTRGLLARNG